MTLLVPSPISRALLGLFLAACAADDSCERTATCPTSADAGPELSEPDPDASMAALDPELSEQSPSAEPLTPLDPPRSVTLFQDGGVAEAAPTTTAEPDEPSGPAGIDASPSGGAPGLDVPPAEPAVVPDAGVSAPATGDAGPVVERDAAVEAMPTADSGSSLDPAEPEPPPTYSLTVQVSGLEGPLTLVIAGTSVTIEGDGPVSVAGLEDGSVHLVAVSVDPPDQVCSVSRSDVTISGADVSDVLVTCVSDVATLGSLALNGAQLSPDFSPQTTEYSVEVGLFTQGLTLDAVPTDSRATLHLNGEAMEAPRSRSLTLPLGTGTHTIEVVAPSGRSVSYLLTATRRTTVERGQILAPSTPSEPGFAHHLSISSDWMFIGREATSPSEPQGHVFQFSGAGWTLDSELAALISTDFHHALSGAICGDTLVVVVQRGTNTTLQDVHFVRRTPAWAHQGVFGLPGNAVGDVACDQGRAAVRTNGGTHIFEDTAQGWRFTDTLVLPLSDETDILRQRLVLEGDVLVVSDPGESSAARGIGGDDSYTCPGVDCASDSGAVFVYELAETGLFQLRHYIKASTARTNQRFGSSIALDGDRLAVGAPGDTAIYQGITTSAVYGSTCAAVGATCAYDSGAVFLYERDGDGYREVSYFKPLGNAQNHQAGAMVSLRGDLLLVGSPGAGSPATSGMVNVFVESEAGWTQTNIGLAPATPAAGDRFAQRGLLSGDTFYGTLSDRANGPNGVVWFR